MKKIYILKKSLCMKELALWACDASQWWNTQILESDRMPLLFAQSWENYKISVSHFPPCAMAYCLGYYHDRMRKGIERPSTGAWKPLPPPLPRSSPIETDIIIRQSRSNWHFYYWWSYWRTMGILGNGYLSKK